jgi:hypothetical protein
MPTLSVSTLWDFSSEAGFLAPKTTACSFIKASAAATGSDGAAEDLAESVCPEAAGLADFFTNTTFPVFAPVRYW